MQRYKWLSKLPSLRMVDAGPLERDQTLLYCGAIALAAIATTLRASLDHILPPGYPFLTYFPAVVLGTALLGFWPGVLLAVLSFFASWYFFIPQFHTFTVTPATSVALGLYLFVTGINIFLIHSMIYLYSRLQRSEQKITELARFQSVLLRELEHRMKNMFTVVASVTKLTAREAETPQEMADTLVERILALSRAQTYRLRPEAEGGEPVNAIVRQVLEPYRENGSIQINLQPRDTVLNARFLQVIGLFLNEMATNSVKYGALGRRGGAATLSDHVNGHTYTLTWVEPFMPSPAAISAASGLAEDQTRRGLGTEMMERLARAYGGTYNREMSDGELRISMQLPTQEPAQPNNA